MRDVKKYKKIEVEVMNNIGVLNTLLNNYKQAKEYIKKALKQVKKEKEIIRRKGLELTLRYNLAHLLKLQLFIRE